ncbi:MAG: acyltransferase [Saprospiraceae bacterium]|nr:acyltransferase [Saprospiraceae bacterium]
MNEHSISRFIKKALLKFRRMLFSIRIIGRLKSWFIFNRYDVLIGKNVRFHGLPKYIQVGDDISIYDNVIMHFGSESNVVFGSKIIFSHNVLIQTSEKLHIGSYVQIGEFTSIRDTTHDYRTDGNMMEGRDISRPIIIGDNVWIGRNCIIMGGAIIESGCVIGANSLVKGHCKANGIYAGIPIKFIKNRLHD